MSYSVDYEISINVSTTQNRGFSNRHIFKIKNAWWIHENVTKVLVESNPALPLGMCFCSC